MRNSDKKPADESSPPKRALDSGGRLQRCGNGLWLSSAAAWSLSGMAVAVREAEPYIWPCSDFPLIFWKISAVRVKPDT